MGFHPMSRQPNRNYDFPWQRVELLPCFVSLDGPCPNAFDRMSMKRIPFSTKIPCQWDAVPRLRRLDNILMRASRFLTREGLDANRRSLARFGSPNALQSDFHWISFPTAIIKSLSLQRKAWYGTILG